MCTAKPPPVQEVRTDHHARASLQKKNPETICSVTVQLYLPAQVILNLCYCEAHLLRKNTEGMTTDEVDTCQEEPETLLYK